MFYLVENISIPVEMIQNIAVEFIENSTKSEIYFNFSSTNHSHLQNGTDDLGRNFLRHEFSIISFLTVLVCTLAVSCFVAILPAFLVHKQEKLGTL